MAFRRIPDWCWFISFAPMRGSSHFLCCCKESNQRNSYPHPKYFMPAPAQKHSRGPAVASAPKGLIGLGSRTVRHIAPHNSLVQRQLAPARFAADGSIGFAWAFASRRFPSHTRRQRGALCRCYFVLNQSVVRCDVADRARSKPGWSFEGTL